MVEVVVVDVVVEVVVVLSSPLPLSDPQAASSGAAVSPIVSPSTAGQRRQPPRLLEDAVTVPISAMAPASLSAIVVGAVFPESALFNRIAG